MTALSSNPAAWLKENAGERMDATLPIFPADRRAFHLARYAFAAERVKGLRVADIACGTGYGSAALMAAGAASVVGIDIDPCAVEYARATHAAGGATFHRAEAAVTGLPPGSVDAVVSFETLEHVPDDAAAVREFVRLLSPGGLLVCSVPLDWGLSRYHVRNYTRESLTALLSPGFDNLTLWNQNSGTPWHNNRGRPAGIVPLTTENDGTAECLIAVGTVR